jgi:hypothetical protein
MTRAGFFVADITPPLGMERPGGYGKVFIEQIHDPLQVRAAVIEQDGTALAFAGIDTVELPLTLDVPRAIRRQIEELTSIPART